MNIFCLGEYVKYINNYGLFNVGDVVKVIERKGDRYLVSSVKGNTIWVSPHELEKI